MAVNIEKAEGLDQFMEEKGIREADVKQVIEAAEASGEKMYKPDTPDCLAKAKCDQSWVFVEYAVLGDDNYKVSGAYSMKTDFAEEL